MKRFLPVIIIVALLAGVGVIATKYNLVNLTSSVLWTSSIPKAGDTVVVDYVGTEDNGTEFDSSKKEGRSPLEFIIDGGSMIKGFNDAVKLMKKGETKKVRIEAKDAYGEEYIVKSMPLNEYKEVITQEVPKNVLTGIISQDLPKAQADQILWGSTVGTEKTLGEATIKITAVSGDNVTVSIDDPQAPFYGKTLTVGLEATAQDGSKVTIKSITGDNVSIDIKPDQEEVSRTETDIIVKSKNPHPLAGKALNFEITLNEIKPATTAEPMPTPDSAE